MNSKQPNHPTTFGRAAWLIGAILVTASASGYFMGLRQTGSQLHPAPSLSLAVPSTVEPAGTDAPIIRAVRYAEEDRLKDGPNAQWSSPLSNLVQPTVDSRSFTNVTEAQRALALKERAGRRAYDGAPPVVPHPITQDSSAACLACHGPGLAVKDKVASKISHTVYTSCTQCHVPAVGTRIPTTETALLEPLAENQFAGLKAPLKGTRAWPQAPPTVPHGTLMRSDCLSCHGPQGLFGLRTPHPDRRSCLQCHAPSAELDQHLFFPATGQPLDSVGQAHSSGAQSSAAPAHEPNAAFRLQKLKPGALSLAPGFTPGDAASIDSFSGFSPFSALPPGPWGRPSCLESGLLSLRSWQLAGLKPRANQRDTDRQ